MPSIEVLLNTIDFMGTLTVTGRGVETVPTTRVQVRLGVEMQGRTASRVQQLVAQRSTAVVELLQSREVEQLQTTGVSLQPAYDSDRSQTSGFIGTNLVSFCTALENVGALLDAAVDAGATRIDQIDWLAADEALKEARQAALQRATQDGLIQAQAVLDALQFNQGEIISIEVHEAGSSPGFAMRMKAAPGQDLTPILQHPQQVQVSVILQISY